VILRFRSLAPVSVLAVMLLANPVDAGPPWISVEIPSNPHHTSTRGATFLVHAYHHSASIDVPMTAMAEGLVDGQRRSLKLDVTRTNLPGVFAVRSSLPKAGAWVVVVTLQESKSSSASALVTLGSDGQVTNVRVPSKTSGDGWVIPQAVTSSDIESELRMAAKIASLQTTVTRGPLANAGALGLVPLVLLFGVVLLRGNRRQGRVQR
jgi:hypothetical protein